MSPGQDVEAWLTGFKSFIKSIDSEEDKYSLFLSNITRECVRKIANSIEIEDLERLEKGMFLLKIN